MDRKKIKSEAWEFIKGKRWKIWWPLLIISLITGVLENLVGPNYANTDIFNYNVTSMPTLTPTQTVLSLIITLIGAFAGVAYTKYILKLVRGEDPEFNDIIECIKERWITILLVEFLGGLIIFGCTLLLVIPGIIMAFAYSMTSYLTVDTDLEAPDVLKKSRTMMKGYKFDFFVFGLSFIGWVLLVIVSFGIASIWFVPYFLVASALYYENLKEVTKK